MRQKFSRRDVLMGSTALAASTTFALPIKAAAPEPTEITPQLIEAAKKEGKVIYYTSVDLPVGERLAKSFQAKYPGIDVRVERSGAERVFQRIGQEYASNVHAVDVVNSSDAAHFIVWKRDGLLAPYVPEDVAKFYPADHKDPDGMFASWRVWLSVIAYNTELVKAADAPKSFADLLDPKWKSKIVKAHPGYSGTIMTATYQMSRDLGWDYFEKLAQQNVMQVQSSADPPKKLSLGERAVMADGNEYNIFQLKESGRGRLCDRGLAADYWPQRHLEGGAKSQRCTAVPELLLQSRSATNRHRCRRVALDASPDQGEARPQALQRDQDHERRRRQRRAHRRRGQGALQQDLSCVMRRVESKHVFRPASHLHLPHTQMRSLPPCGGGLGRGVVANNRALQKLHDRKATTDSSADTSSRVTPLPVPPPQGGRERLTSNRAKRTQLSVSRSPDYIVHASGVRP